MQLGAADSVEADGLTHLNTYLRLWSSLGYEERDCELVTPERAIANQLDAPLMSFCGFEGVLD